MELDIDEDGDPIDSCFVNIKHEKNKDDFPDVSDELSGNEKHAYQALNWYKALHKHFGDEIMLPDGKGKKSDIRTKAYIFWNLQNNWNECRGLDHNVQRDENMNDKEYAEKSAKVMSGFAEKTGLASGGDAIWDAKGVQDNMRHPLKRLEEKKLVCEGDYWYLKQEFIDGME
jgi:hypothetical protein